MPDLAIGVDVGGTKTAAGLVDEAGNVLRRERRLTPASEPEGIVRTIGSLVAALRLAAGQPVSRVGVAVPGQYDARQGRFVRIANLALRGYPFRDRLQEELGGAVIVENDTNAAALGEWSQGAGRGYRDFVYVAIGTGIGAGVILDERLVRGAHGSAGEIGHTVVEKDGPCCPCGNRGCLELFASGGALTGRARALAATHPDSLLGRWSRDGQAINAGDLFRAADQGDAVAEAAAAEGARYLAIGLNNLIELFDPELVAVGGGLSQIGLPLFDRLVRAIREQRPASPDISGRIVPAVLREDAGIIGAATAARRI